MPTGQQTYFTPFFIPEFEQVNVSWVIIKWSLINSGCPLSSGKKFFQNETFADSISAEFIFTNLPQKSEI